MKSLLAMCVLALTLQSCMYTISLNHSEGVASDLVDETADPTTTADVNK